MEEGVSAVKLPMIIDIIRKLFFELADAEALEYQCRARVDTPPGAYLKVLWRKAADVEAHTKVGAIIGGGTEAQVRELSQYGRLLGMLVLLRDDWLDTLDPEELRHRLKKECPPLPVLYAAQDPKIKDQILSILRKKSLAKIDAERILALVQPKGFENVETFMTRTHTDAYSHLEKARCEETYLKLFVASQMPSSREIKELTTTRS
jgi:geranylgeranyl pyrophosphate synthase